MRVILLVLMFCALPCFMSSAQAQRVVVIPPHGAGEGVIIIGDLPAQARAIVKQELGCEPKLAWIYWHWFLFGANFDFWRTDGRFALFHDDKYWELPRETLGDLFGPENESMLSTPWSYYFPPGLVTIIVLIAVVVLWVIWAERAGKRFEALARDERYQAAMQAYLQHLPKAGLATSEEHQEGLAAGVAHLVTHGVKPRTARSQLSALVRAAALDHVNDLRIAAFEFAEAGQWQAAQEHFQAAADVAYYWNKESAKFLNGRVEWCRQQAERAGKE